MSEAPALVLDRIAKRFGDIQALEEASLTVQRGTLHALLGENGAGKTTLMRVAFGLLRPDAGTVAVDGRAFNARSPLDAIARGIGMVHQHFTIVPAMTVAENVALGGRGRYRKNEANETVFRIGAESGLVLDPDVRAGDLPVSAQQRLEIVKALARGARILVLDEPTAVLAPPEAADLLQVLRRFTAAGGAVVLITHKLREALEAADTITVLRRGRSVWSGTPEETNELALARAIVGELPDTGARQATMPGAVALAARDLRVRDGRGTLRVRGVSLEVRSGEVLGVAGVEGAGQHEMLRVLAGRARPESGSVERPASVAFIPEDRQRDALILNFSLAENIALRGAGTARGVMPWRSVGERTSRLLQRFEVRPARTEARARELSGGNQQRLVLARELGDQPTVIIAENPTRGLDVAAATAVHRQLLDMRDGGAGVVLYSSDLDEVLELADRVIVMHGGVAREMPLDRGAIALALLGGAA